MSVVFAFATKLVVGNPPIIKLPNPIFALPDIGNDKSTSINIPFNFHSLYDYCSWMYNALLFGPAH
jgi:hypothetical protein